MIGDDDNAGETAGRWLLSARVRAAGCLGRTFCAALAKPGSYSGGFRPPVVCADDFGGRRPLLQGGVTKVAVRGVGLAQRRRGGVAGVFLLMLALCVRAQESAAIKGGIRGTIYDADFNVPVPAVRVSVPEANRSTNTVEAGHYAFADLAPGIYTVMFAKEGFQRETRINVLVKAGVFAEVDTRLFGEYTDMEELVVSDIDLGGTSDVGLLNLRAQSVAMIDTVGAELMSRAGAGTAAAALKLVTGASIQDGKYVVIRGLGDRYTSVMVNGVRMPTADKDRRAVHMDQFPSAVINSIQVTKTFTPEQQGDASGGGVDIVTKGMPDSLVLSASVSLEYDTEATGNRDFLSYKGGGNNSFGIRQGGLERLLFWNPKDQTGSRGADVSSSSKLENKMPGPNYGWKYSAGDSWDLDGATAGGLLAMSYNQKYKYRDTERINLVASDSASNVRADTGNPDTELVSMDEQLWSACAVTGIRNAMNDVHATLLFTHLSRDVVNEKSGDPEISPLRTNEFVIGPRRYVVESEAYSQNRRVTQLYTEGDNGTAQLAGKHTFEYLHDAELTWSLAYNVAETLEPDRRQVNASYYYARLSRTINGVYDPIGSYVTGPGWSFDRFERRWQDTREQTGQAQLNWKQPFTVWEQEGYVKAGVFGDNLFRTYRNRAYTDGGGLPAVPATNDWDFSSWGALDGVTIQPFNDYTVEYDARQKIDAYYAMFKAPLPSWVELVGGARVEWTAMQTEVRAPFSPDGTIPTYGLWVDPNNPGLGPIMSFNAGAPAADAAANLMERDILPACGLTFHVRDDTQIRLAVSQTIARPTFKELTPVVYTDFDPSRVFVGNPKLGLSHLNNYDFRVEWRPAAGDLLAGSVFMKQLTDPIQYTVYRDGLPGSPDYVYPENYPSGKILGYELEMRKNLRFISDWLRDLTAGANATFQKSTVDYSDILMNKLRFTGVTSDSRPMDGQPAYLYNINLFYDNEPSGVSLGIFYNMKGETYVGGESWNPGAYTPNLVEKPIGSLDITFGYKFAKNWRLGLEAKNLLNPSVESIYRSSVWNKDQPRSSYRPGRTYSMSLGCTF